MKLTTLKNLKYLKKNVEWSKKLIDETKRTVKLDLESMEGVPSKKLQMVGKKIDEYGDDLSAEGQLKLLIYIMSALVHHERYGGFNEQQVRKLSQYAFAILQTQGIAPGISRLSFLYSELHLVLSQIYRRHGKHLRSFWEHQISFQLTGREAENTAGLKALALAIRSLRLGFANTALQQFVLAEENATSPAQFKRARLGRVMCLRLMGCNNEATELSKMTKTECQLSEREQIELAWEEICRNVTESGDLAEMVRAVKKTGSHHFAIFIMEAHLWARSYPSTRWISQLPSMKWLARNKVLNPKRHGLCFDCALMIDKCYDKDYPMSLRLRELGELLDKIDRLISIDKELLVWAAAMRWLNRHRSPELASMALSQYEGISLKLSNGKSHDVLKICPDLLGKNWHFNKSA